MRLFATSIALAIVGNVLYHLAQKSIPASASPLGSLLVAYGIAFFATALLAVAFPRSPVFGGHGSWSLASVGVGFAIVAIELGFLLA